MLVLVGYGETTTAAAKVFGGQNPGTLTLAGLETAKQYAEALRGVLFETVYYGGNLFDSNGGPIFDEPARVTATMISPHLIGFHGDGSLREPSAGTYEGMTFADLKKQLPPRQYRLWDRDFFIAPPGGESLADASERAFTWFERWVAEPYRMDPQNTLVVVGPVMLKLLLGRLQQLEETAVAQLKPLDLPYSFDTIP
jgi:broad specificity phosphatase PhoE